VKRSSVIVAVVIGLAGAAPASAEPLRLAQYFAADIIPPHEAVTIIRSIGLYPLNRPRFRGRFYVLSAEDRRGDVVRVVVDGYAAQVVSVRPMRRAPLEYDPPLRRPYPPEAPMIEAEPFPDGFGSDDEAITGSLPPPRNAPRVISAPPLPPTAAPRRVNVPSDAPLPRPHPVRHAALAAPAAPAHADKPEAAGKKPDNVETAERPAEAPKTEIRKIEIKKPEPAPEKSKPTFPPYSPWE
jgi:hypothetical protein